MSDDLDSKAKKQLGFLLWGLALGLLLLYFAIDGILNEGDWDFGTCYGAIVLLGFGAFFVWNALQVFAGPGKKRGKRRRRKNKEMCIDRIMHNSGRDSKQ